MIKRIIAISICFFLCSGLFGSHAIQNKQENNHFFQDIIQVTFPDIEDIQIEEKGNSHSLKLSTCHKYISDESARLPCKSIVLALPQTSKNPICTVKDCSFEKLDGFYQLSTKSNIVCYNPDKSLQLSNYFNTYPSLPKEKGQNIYPKKQITIQCKGSLADIPYISLNVCPFKYIHSTGELFYAEKMTILVSYEVINSEIKQKNDLQIRFLNLENFHNNYLKQKNSLNKNEINDYVIITTDDFIGSIEESTFIHWKNSLGFSCKIITITDELISEQNGHDLAAKIRSFLRQYYQLWEIKYVLIVGDYKTIPMRYCYPDPTNHRLDVFDIYSGEVPTDYYYADLSYSDEESWDKDGDGFFGEYGEDQPDFLAEIFIGRIPINNKNRITYTLNKIVRFECDTAIWKTNALHAGAFFYFDNEDNQYFEMDGAVLSNQIEQDLMDDWFISHYSEQEGLYTSAFKWPSLTEQSFIQDWKLGKYGIVNWQGHGWTTGVARKVWSTDDGDNIPEANEIDWPYFITLASDLDDDYPSIVTAVSCYVGCPEPHSNGNLGIKLLTDPTFGAGVAIIASARSPYGSIDWPTNLGGSDSIIYEFNKNIIKNNQSIGQALYTAKFFCNQEYGWANYIEYIDMYTFNLFGDPSLMLYGNDINTPPSTPTIKGSNKAAINEEVSYDIMSVDLNNDPISYYIEFEEGQGYVTNNTYPSGETITESWIWEEQGTFLIRVQAEDIHGAKSDWGELQVSMSKNKWKDIFNHNWFIRHPLIHFIFQRFLIMAIN